MVRPLKKPSRHSVIGTKIILRFDKYASWYGFVYVCEKEAYVPQNP